MRNKSKSLSGSKAYPSVITTVSRATAARRAVYEIRKSSYKKEREEPITKRLSQPSRRIRQRLNASNRSKHKAKEATVKTAHNA